MSLKQESDEVIDLTSEGGDVKVKQEDVADDVTGTEQRAINNRVASSGNDDEMDEEEGEEEHAKDDQQKQPRRSTKRKGDASACYIDGLGGEEEDEEEESLDEDAEEESEGEAEQQGVGTFVPRADIVENDVLVPKGLGCRYSNWSGNQRLRSYVKARAMVYHNNTTSEQKAKLVKAVRDRVKDQGGRFLQEHSDTEGREFREMKPAKIETKITNIFYHRATKKHVADQRLALTSDRPVNAADATADAQVRPEIASTSASSKPIRTAVSTARQSAANPPVNDQNGSVVAVSASSDPSTVSAKRGPSDSSAQEASPSSKRRSGNVTINQSNIAVLPRDTSADSSDDAKPPAQVTTAPIDGKKDGVLTTTAHSAAPAGVANVVNGQGLQLSSGTDNSAHHTNVPDKILIAGQTQAIVAHAKPAPTNPNPAAAAMVSNATQPAVMATQLGAAFNRTGAGAPNASALAGDTATLAGQDSAADAYRAATALKKNGTLMASRRELGKKLRGLVQELALDPSLLAVSEQDDQAGTTFRDLHLDKKVLVNFELEVANDQMEDLFSNLSASMDQLNKCKAAAKAFEERNRTEMEGIRTAAEAALRTHKLAALEAAHRPGAS